MSCKKSVLVKFKIVGFFVNTLTADDKYSSRNIQNLTQQLQTAIDQKQKAFYRIFITSIEFLLHISNLEEVQTFLPKKMSLPASVFMKLLMAKKDVT